MNNGIPLLLMAGHIITKSTARKRDTLSCDILCKSMDIKLCSQQNLPELVAIANQSYLDHYTYLWYDNGVEYTRFNFSDHQLKEELANPNAVFYLIVEENKTVGYLKLNIDKGVQEYPAAISLELQRLYFIQSASGKGLGKLAVDFVIDYARKKNKKIVWLTSMDSSRAVAFYQKLGFSTHSHYFLTFPTMKEEYRKILVMCREL